MSKDQRLSMRISDELHDHLKAAAKEQDRSIAYVAERVLMTHFRGTPQVTTQMIRDVARFDSRPASPVPKPGRG